MTYPAHEGDVQISRVHNLALCREIGERLGISLRQRPVGMPLNLMRLMEKLREGPPNAQSVEKPLEEFSRPPNLIEP